MDKAAPLVAGVSGFNKIPVPLPRMRRFIVILWLFSVLTSTVGVGIRSVYCYCTGKTGFSLYNGFASKANDCHRDADRRACSTPDLARLSASPKASADAGCCRPTSCNVAAGKPCTSTKVFYFKLKTDVIQTETEQLPVFCAAADLVFQRIEWPLVAVSFPKKESIPYLAERGPPRPFGRMLLPRVQAWLC